MDQCRQRIKEWQVKLKRELDVYKKTIIFSLRPSVRINNFNNGTVFLSPTLGYYNSCFQPQIAWSSLKSIQETLEAIMEQIGQDKPTAALEKTPPPVEKFKEMEKETLIRYYSPPQEEKFKETVIYTLLFTMSIPVNCIDMMIILLCL